MAQRRVARLGLTLLAAITLAGCSPQGWGPGMAGVGGPRPGLSGHRSAGAFAAAGAVDPIEGPEPRADRLPDETIVVPARPTRNVPAPTTGNAARAYVSPAETLPAILALVESAEKSIYLETFNFGLESYGEKLVPRLVAKAQAGVEVKVMMDYCGSRFLTGHGELLKRLRDGGVEVRRYLPRVITKDDRRIGVNITHRKVYLADGKRGMVGGVNLMKEFDSIHQDIMVDFRGPVVADLYREFALDWKAARGGALNQAPVPPTGPAGPVQAQVVVTSPAEGRFEARDAIYAGIDAARSSIVIENQYLWDDRLIKRLFAALKRGVKVRVMIPGAEHKKIFINIHSEELKKLVDAGAEARTYLGTPADAHLHVKYYSVDDRWAAIGSTNGDTRAYLDNQELQVVLVDPAFAKDLRERLFERDWAQHSEPFVYKPSSILTRPFRSLLELIDYWL